MTLPAKNEDVQRNLIEAAGQIFAEIGYEAATVRQITERAHVNVAAVNYYFGDKLQLYRTVLKSITERTVHTIEAHCTAATAEQRLRQFVRTVLTTEDNEEHAWAPMLMAREVNGLQATPPEILVEVSRPVHAIAMKLVRDLVGEQAQPDSLRLASSLLLSVTFNCLSQQRLDRLLYPEVVFDTEHLEADLERLCGFLLTGIQGLMKTQLP